MPSPNRHSHDWIDQRSLAIDVRIAELIRKDPALLERAKENVARWIRQRNSPPTSSLHEWQRILNESPVEEILKLLTRFDDEARRLRQSSPFCGILPEEERHAILKEYETL